ncbi:hypothetical protein GUITHDRAFT_148968 [Guillardia theta CCMP2712]|uniref:Protein kinase domain-containing protein n=1 Tax=Guillardia theta (strain CCMP2712) TaxID=905079 RepID=L1I6R6_GUITC|nr:hypothetical protein GUITHDRAFT_148968 [Guillardia theta CCMP2712]EKX31931.1 hypothetical protein GUITHDRAFT_148968 [Guillardia theta CCMP2712]|eukprot:XP_005818911.1 hypothetical protein GUITHDRAFT_148968 [Guillardia theta CCMP2712]
MGQLEHPNVAQCFEMHSIAEGITYVRMEAIQGSDLDALLKIHTRFSEDEAVAIIRGVLKGLSALHARAIVHCGINPSNIMIAKMAPFVKHQDAAYLAPEQLLEGKHASTAIDIWAVGILLYHMLSGEFPFEISEKMEDMIHCIHWHALLHLD